MKVEVDNTSYKAQEVKEHHLEIAAHIKALSSMLKIKHDEEIVSVEFHSEDTIYIIIDNGIKRNNKKNNPG
tara:strand:+ start:4916 stop:5128 length:213 start_codon:yes stop_codon:yes gene_type:complete